MKKKSSIIILLLIITVCILNIYGYRKNVMYANKDNSTYLDDNDMFSDDEKNKMICDAKDMNVYIRRYKIISSEKYPVPLYIKQRMVDTIKKRGDRLADQCQVCLDKLEDEDVFQVRLCFKKQSFNDNPNYFNEEFVNRVFDAIVSRGKVDFVKNYNQDDSEIIFTRDDIMQITGQSGLYGKGGIMYCFMYQDTEVNGVIKKYGEENLNLEVVVDGQIISKERSSIPDAYIKPINDGDIFIFDVNDWFDCCYLEELVREGPLLVELELVE